MGGGALVLGTTGMENSDAGLPISVRSRAHTGRAQCVVDCGDWAWQRGLRLTSEISSSTPVS